MVDPALLRRMSLLGGLSEEDQAHVWSLFEERAYPPGGVVVEEGTPGRELFVIAEGSAEVLKRASDGQSIRLARLEAGACFGEMALVGIMKRSATVRATAPLRVLVLPWAQIVALSHTNAPLFTMLVMNLARDLCRRLQATDVLLAEFGPTAFIGEPKRAEPHGYSR